MADQTRPVHYVYKLIPTSAAPPNPLPDALPLSKLDEESGYIHLSTARQLVGTLRNFFASDEEIYVLRLDYETLKQDIRWESPDSSVGGTVDDDEMFPHLYNGTPPKLGCNEVESMKLLKRVGEQWKLDIISDAVGWIV